MNAIILETNLTPEEIDKLKIEKFGSIENADAIARQVIDTARENIASLQQKFGLSFCQAVEAIEGGLEVAHFTFHLENQGDDLALQTSGVKH